MFSNQVNFGREGWLAEIHYWMLKVCKRIRSRLKTLHDYPVSLGLQLLLADARPRLYAQEAKCFFVTVSRKLSFP